VRWHARESGLARSDWHALVRLVHPRDAALAAEMADALGTTLDYIGVPQAPGLAAEAAATAAPMPGLIDGVVCVAAEAMDATPRPMRAALLAATRRARELGFTLETMEAALAPALPPAQTKKPAR
jgi:hypothetical protein